MYYIMSYTWRVLLELRSITINNEWNRKTMFLVFIFSVITKKIVNNKVTFSTQFILIHSSRIKPILLRISVALSKYNLQLWLITFLSLLILVSLNCLKDYYSYLLKGFSWSFINGKRSGLIKRKKKK